jgi:hypothetical protein
LALVILAQPALAVDECGVAPAGGTVTCAAAAFEYPDGVTYLPPTGPLTVVLNSDTVIDTTPSGNVGVDISTGAQNQTITAAPNSSVTTTGINADAYRLSTTGAGTITATTGIINTSGLNAWGINAVSDAGNLTLTGTDTTTTGSTAYGINAVTGSGTLDVTTGTVSTAGVGATGVRLNSTTGNIVIAGGTVGTAEADAAGITAQTGGTGTIELTGGTVTTVGNNSRGVSLTSVSGDVSIDGTTATTSGFLSRALSADSDSGNVTITNGTANTSGTLSRGISATTNSGNVEVTGANSTTTGAFSRGIAALSTSGNVTVNDATVNTEGFGSRGIVASSDGGNVIINGATIGTLGDFSIGAFANSSGTGTVSVTNTAITTAGNNSTGIAATTADGALSVNTGNVTTTGDNALGVSATSGTGNVTVTGTGGTISTSGVGSTGILASTGGAGIVNVSGGTITTTDGAIGVDASSAEGALTVAPAGVTTAGDGGIGILAISSGSTTTVGTAATTVATAGNGAFGVLALGADGTTVNYGSITTTGDTALGIFVPGGGTTVSVVGAPAGTLSTNGAGSHGIVVTANETVAVNVGRVSAIGTGSQGILATAGTSGSVTAAGGVAADGDAVTLNTIEAAAVTLGGNTTSATGTGVLINAGTTANLTVNAGGSLTGDVRGATITSVDGATITNSGVISGNALGTNVAFDVDGAGAATVLNNASGVINGRIFLTDGDDLVTNNGTFNASGTSLFGGGADTFSNAGTLAVLPGTVVPGTVTFAGLNAFNNTGGLVDLRNGHTGDNLVLPGTYTGSGNARLAIDVNLNTPVTSTDLLTIGGAATGSTAVTINRLGSPAILSTAAGTIFADAGVGSTAGAFVIAPTSQVDGVIQYGVVYNPLTNDYALVSAPSAAAYRTSLYGDGVRNLWLQSGDAWTSHMRELRDNIAANGPGGAGGRFWFQGYGSWEKRTSGRTVTFNGITSNVDLGYDQDYYGFQMGLDLGTPVGPEGGFNFGVTGGYQNSNMSFASNTVADRIKFNVVNGGLYASFNSGIFFINALGKYDYYWGETSSPSGMFGFDTNGSVWGAKAEAGLRFGTDFFIEPAVSVSWTNSDFDSFVVPSGNFAINDEDGLRGKAGARFGYVTQMGGAKVSLYGGANYVREFRGRSNVVFTSGGQTAAFSSPRNADYAEGILGVNVGSDAGKISGFFEGRYADGRDYDGYGVRGGMRVRF